MRPERDKRSTAASAAVCRIRQENSGFRHGSSALPGVSLSKTPQWRLRKVNVMTRWTASDIPSQSGRTAVVTGTGGLGFEDALALARAGAQVILAGRNPSKGADAVSRIRREAPQSKVGFERLDLADLGSVAAFAERLTKDRDSLDLLVNNAGVMVPPQRQVTADGFELQFGTNYLGHFALTAHLLPLLRRAKDARVISLSSVAAPQGAIDFDDLNAVQSYRPMPVYAQSKLACLMFAFELQRRSDSTSWGITSIAAHPGISRTDLLHNGPGRRSIQGLVRSYLPFLFQPADRGALPTLFAATSPEAQPGAYYGPDGIAEMRGYPTSAKVPPQALDQAVAARLWQVSETLTRVRFGQGMVEPAPLLLAKPIRSEAA
ncbi:SDR family oxidoreductase [Sphingomonas sp. DT-204]|uniref:SDR family oxidoreductase n=1 Tax=Sphingomonas sp. DT-204 TaxID=3396166 RepID=UPI003F1D0E80